MTLTEWQKRLEYWKKHPEKREEYRRKKRKHSKTYYDKNKNDPEFVQMHLDATKKWREENPDKVKDRDARYYQENKEKAYIWNKNWREKNRELSACYQRQYVKKRYKNDIQYKLTISLRTRLNRAIKNNQKTGSAVGELGCTIDEFKVYIENKFQEGMSWENWKYDGWHLDHIKPLSSFDLTDREQFLEACHYTNLQPLWGWQNMQKHDKINWKLN